MAFASLAAGVAGSCSATGDGDFKASSGASANSGGAAASSSSSEGGDLGIVVGAGGAGGGKGGCQQLDVKFEPQTPTVLILVDRSGSMFDGGYWDPLKTAVLNVVQNVQDKVRFGLLTFTGITGQQCPLLSGTDAITLSNYAAIKAAYDAASVKPGGKLETPTGDTLNNKVVPELLAIKEPGAKYILFVTDGEPDRCDDGIAECARDDVVGAVQAAYGQKIGTFVFGLGTGTFAQHLQDVANAGAGQPVQNPGPNALGACFGGNLSNAKGTYADAGGAAKFYTPDPTDASALETELNAAIGGAKSCSFDLQGKIEVDLDNVAQGEVFIDGKPVTYDDKNGWHMKSATELEVVGAACAQLKVAQQGISFNFPCEIIIPK